MGQDYTRRHMASGTSLRSLEALLTPFQYQYQGVLVWSVWVEYFIGYRGSRLAHPCGFEVTDESARQARSPGSLSSRSIVSV
jgi:hypothetical protein